MTTKELLRHFVTEKSEPAFAELVGRHINLVYSAALRQVSGDSGAAQDVTQQVFADLARKAPRLVRHTSLTGWLYTSTRYLAANARRSERRRVLREQQAHAMNQLLNPTASDTAWHELRPVLDEVTHQLRSADREAILLRYFEGLSLAEVGAKLDLTENAARMKVDRALDKLRAELAKRGVTSTVATLSTVLAERAVGASPAGLADQVSRAAFPFATVAGAGGVFGFLINFAAPSKAILLMAAIAISLFFVVKQSARNEPVGLRETGGGSLAPSLALAASGDHGGISASNSSAASWPQSTNKLLLRIVAADSGRAVPMTEIDAELWIGLNGYAANLPTETRRHRFLSTRFGVVEVPVPQPPPSALFLWTKANGFADTCLLWKADRGDRIPAEYTLRLDGAVLMGGRVVDKGGRPVAGARVVLRCVAEKNLADARPQDHAAAGFETLTDAQGQWSINRIAAEVFPGLGVGANHPEYMHEEVSIPEHQEAGKQMLAGTHIFQLNRTLALRGVVVDPDGQPILNAEIRTALEFTRLDGIGPVPWLSPATTNQTDGSFTLGGFYPGRYLLAVEAKGFVQTNLDVDPDEDSDSLRLTLRRGEKILKLRVVDPQGSPVTKARVGCDVSGRFGTRVSFPDDTRQSDAEGRVEWDSTPAEGATFDVWASGFIPVVGLRLVPDADEHIINLFPMPKGADEPHWAPNGMSGFHPYIPGILPGLTNSQARFSLY